MPDLKPPAPSPAVERPAGASVPQASPPEEAVAEKLGAGFADFVRAHQGLVLRTARNLVGNAADAEDVAQEAFLRLYRHRDRLDPSRSPVGWVYRLTVRAALDLLDRRRRDRRLEEGLRGQHGTEAMWPQRDWAEAEELKRILTGSLEILPPRVRAVFVLMEVEGLEVRDVARVLRITRITVRRHISRGRAELREYLRRSHSELLES